MEEDYKSACILGKSCKLLVMAIKFVLTCKQGSLSFFPSSLSLPFFPSSLPFFWFTFQGGEFYLVENKSDSTWSAVMPPNKLKDQTQ